MKGKANMKILKIRTAKNSRAKCSICNEPIIEGEGSCIASNVTDNQGRWKGRGYLCHKCTKRTLEAAKDMWIRMISDLETKNQLTTEQLQERKIPRML
jgi:uncharacterized protein with PIN domain